MAATAVVNGWACSAGWRPSWGGSTSTAPGQSHAGAAAGYAIQASTSYLATDEVTLRADLTRSAAPDATTGVLEELTSFTLAYEQFFLPKTAVYVNGLYQHQDEVSGDFTRDYLAFEPGLRVRLTEDVDLWCAYRLQWQEDQSSTSGLSNAVLARLSYSVPAWSEAP